MESPGSVVHRLLHQFQYAISQYDKGDADFHEVGPNPSVHVMAIRYLYIQVHDTHDCSAQEISQCLRNIFSKRLSSKPAQDVLSSNGEVTDKSLQSFLLLWISQFAFENWVRAIFSNMPGQFRKKASFPYFANIAAETFQANVLLPCMPIIRREFLMYFRGNEEISIVRERTMLGLYRLLEATRYPSKFYAQHFLSHVLVFTKNWFEKEADKLIASCRSLQQLCKDVDPTKSSYLQRVSKVVSIGTMRKVERAYIWAFFMRKMPDMVMRYQEEYFQLLQAKRERALSEINSVLRYSNGSTYILLAVMERFAKSVLFCPVEPSSDEAMSECSQHGLINIFHIRCRNLQLRNDDNVYNHDDMLRLFKTVESILSACRIHKQLHIKVSMMFRKHMKVTCKQCTLPCRFAKFIGEHDLCYKHVSGFVKFMKYLLVVSAHHHQTSSIYANFLLDRCIDGKMREAKIEYEVAKLFHSDEYEETARMFALLKDWEENRNLDRKSGYWSENMNTESGLCKCTFQAYDSRFVEELGFSDLRVPPQFEAFHSKMKSHYESTHSSKNVVFSSRLGRVTVQTTFLSDDGKREIRLDVNVDQFSVIDMFQKTDRCTVSEICQALVPVVPKLSSRVTENQVKAVISSLTSPKCTLLYVESGSTEISRSDAIRVNSKFRGKDALVKAPKPNYLTEPHLLERKCEAFISHILEAAIVKVVKEKKKIGEGDLEGVVRDHVRPHISFLKTEVFQNSLSRLIEHEYLFADRRDSCPRRVVSYNEL